MLNNIQIYHIKAEDPMINTSIGKRMHIEKEINVKVNVW